MSKPTVSELFRSRLLASAADCILVAGAVKTSLFILPTFDSYVGGAQTNITTILVALVPLFYYSWFEISSLKATPGKMLANLQVSDAESSAMSAFSYTLLASIVFWAMICACGLFIALLFAAINLCTKANLPFTYVGWMGLLVSWPLACVPFNTKNGYRTTLDIVSRKIVNPTMVLNRSISTQLLWATVIGFFCALLRNLLNAEDANTFFGTFLCGASIAYLVAGMARKRDIVSRHISPELMNQKSFHLPQNNATDGSSIVHTSSELPKKARP